MRLAYKYGMLGILQQQETALTPALHTLVSPMFSDAVGYTQQVEMVLETAIFAEDCKCARILAVSEAFIVKHFDSLASGFALSSRLSSASLLRIAQGVSIVGADTISKLHEALGASQTEAKVLSRSRYEKGMICPRCNQRLDLSHKDNVVHLVRSSSCKWPAACNCRISEMSVTEISQSLLQLAKSSTQGN